MKIPMSFIVYVMCLGLLIPSAHIYTLNRIAFWGPWNIPCGIAMYTKHLTDSLIKIGYSVAHYDYTLASEAVYGKALEDKIEMLAIHYAEGINPEHHALLALMEHFKHAGIKIVFIMHAEFDNAQELASSAHRVIYHKKPQYITRFSNVTILPMGVPVFNPSHTRQALRQKYGYTPSDKILVSTGFLLPSKEMDSILAHLAPFIKNDPSIKVQLLHAFTPRAQEACWQAYRNLMDVINTYHLHQQVTLITDFIPQEELNERLYLSDLGYQWFCADTTATSAVAKEYISARTPLVIPDFTHFHDVHYHGIKVTYRDKRILVGALCQLLYQPQRLQIMRRHLSRLYEQYNYDVIIKGYDAVFQAL